ncbi:MAG: histidine--tRNA ligase [Nanoarchaeota archaeon]
MIIEVDTVKGFQDYLPPESLKRKEVKRVIEKYFSLYGFLPIETPFIEFDEIMKPDALPNEEQDEAVSDRFRLKDRGGRNLGLRYEFTFQLNRIMKMNPTMKLPFRRYQIGEVFRDEPIGVGRFRQFTQCDVDIIGDSNVNSEAELITMASSILKELNIPFEIQINNRKLLNEIIESVEIKNIKQVMRELDKIDKIGEDTVKSNLRKFADPNQIMTLFKLMEKDITFFKDNAFEGIKDLETLSTLCKKNGIVTKFNPFMIRGFGYYTGNIYEIKLPKKSTIVAGGRYDKSVGKYLNREIPAVGISFGLERVTQLANIPIPAPIKAIILSIQQNTVSNSLAKKFRESGIPVLVSEDKIGKSLEYADAKGIPFVIFIGEDEVKKKKFKIRNMQSGEERMLGEKSIISFLKKQNLFIIPEQLEKAEKVEKTHKKDNAQEMIDEIK